MSATVSICLDIVQLKVVEWLQVNSLTKEIPGDFIEKIKRSDRAKYFSFSGIIIFLSFVHSLCYSRFSIKIALTIIELIIKATISANCVNVDLLTNII